METGKFTHPNWAQALIAKAVGNWDPHDVAVRFEDDRRIIFLHYKEHMEYCVEKADGCVRRQ